MSDLAKNEGRRVWGRMAIAAVLSIGGLAVAILLLLAGPEWEWVATVLGLPIGCAAIAMALFVGHRSSTPARPLARATKLWIAVLIVLAIVAPVAGRYYSDNLADLQADLGPSFELRREAVKAVPVVAEKPYRQGELTFTARLAALGELGDCVLAGHLTITPIVAGERLDEVRADHQASVSIAIPAHIGETTLEVRYVNQLQHDCAVSVTLTNGRIERW